MRREGDITMIYTDLQVRARGEGSEEGVRREGDITMIYTDLQVRARGVGWGEGRGGE